MSTAAPPRRLCSVIAKAQGDKPLGTAWAVRRMLAMELELPWPEDFFAARAFPVGMGEKLAALWAEHPETGILAFAPDRVNTVPGMTRIIDFRYPEPPHAAAGRREYLVPAGQVGDFFPRLFVDDPSAMEIRGVQPVAFAGRDLFVCTHGTVDACCAKFGFPLYRELHRIAAEANAGVRVWRSTHFGGHRFAATLIDFPEGRFWGFMTPERGRMLIAREGDVADLRGSYRGWAGHASVAVQHLEGEILMREGWAWTSWPHQAEILDGPDQSVVSLRVTAFPPDSPAVVYAGVVAEAGLLPVLHSTDGELEDEMQYEVRELRRLPG
ncbi:MAG: sucrase ferredoxin [Thermomicrobiales bacterium]